MRSNDEVKILLYDVLKKLVKKSFHKRGFDDTFTAGELKEIKEIDEFLRTVNQHKDHPMFEDTRVKYTCISFRATYIRRNGTEISTFFNHFVNQTEYEYSKVEYFIAKCIYRLAKNRHIEVFFAVNCLKANPINNEPLEEHQKQIFIPERKGENLLSSSALYADIDLPPQFVSLGNEEVLGLLQKDYGELFVNIPPTMMVRSGGGIHIYYAFPESYYLVTKEQVLFYVEMLRTLQQIFEKSGGDCRCVDCTRILRVPNCKNRKPKYGPEGKNVSIIYKTDVNYEPEDLSEKLKFLLSGGMTGLFQEVLDELFSDYDEVTEEPELLTFEDEEDDEKDFLEIPIESLPFEEPEPMELKVSDTTKQLIDLGYKGIQPYYSYLGETYYQNKDMMCYIQNRSTTDGVRHTLLFFFSYNWYVYNRVRTYEDLYYRAKRLNEQFKPPLEETELCQAVKGCFKTLESRNHFNLAIRNDTIQQYLHFTEQEKKYCCIGLYCDSQQEYESAVKERNRRYSKQKYVKQLEKKGIKRNIGELGQLQKENKEQCKSLLTENPGMSSKEFFERTGLSKTTYNRYKSELGNTKEKSLQQQRDYYLQPFVDNPGISCNEYIQQLQCSKSTFRKYRQIYNKKFR